MTPPLNITEAKEILGNEFKFTAEDTNKIIQHLKLPKTSSILDVGTGIGSMAITLAINGYNVLTGEPEEDTSVYAKHDWLGNAKKVRVDHLIKFQAFDARNMPFDDNTFDAIFFLGSFHHMDKNNRVDILHECVRTSNDNAIICFFEPNQDAVKIIMELDPSHPEPADPEIYIKGLNLKSEIINGIFFDTFILRK